MFLILVELNITISSYGKDDPHYSGGRSFKINGVFTGTQARGINVLVLSHINGQQLGAKDFDTHDAADAGIKMVEFIEAFPNGSILLFAAKESTDAKLPQQTKEYLSNFGSIGINNMQFRSGFAMLTAKSKKPAWFVEKSAERYKGPCIIHASLRSPLV